MIDLDGVSFAYARPIMQGLSLRVARGELVGVLGPNGAGKSTLLRLALGLLPPAAGAVRLDGAELSSLSRREIARRAAAMMQDEPAGFPVTVKDCVLLGRVAHLPSHGFESPEDLRAAAQAMAETNTTALAERMLHTLSGGERRRVLLARALAQGTPALVLDEPAANLDLAHQLELFALLRARATGGAAVLVTVHDLNLAARYCDRVLLMEDAQTASIGPPAELLTAERVRRVFGVDVQLGRTEDGVPYFVALRPATATATDSVDG